MEVQLASTVAFISRILHRRCAPHKTGPWHTVTHTKGTGPERQKHEGAFVTLARIGKGSGVNKLSTFT